MSCANADRWTRGRGDEKKMYGNIRRSQNKDHAEIRRNQGGARQEESKVILYGGIIESTSVDPARA